jgi:hypothetical protein
MDMRFKIFVAEDNVSYTTVFYDVAPMRFKVLVAEDM